MRTIDPIARAAAPNATLCNIPLRLRYSLRFGRFSLWPDERLLLLNSAPIRIGARAFDILIALVATPNELMTKKELIARAWPGTFVDEINLRVTIAALRKALGDSNHRMIRTDPGRGYVFTPQVTVGIKPRRSDRVSLPPQRHVADDEAGIIGRRAFIDGVAIQLQCKRLITIAGPGGIGKTTVATACAELLAGSFSDGARFVDLSTVTDPASVAVVIANAVGTETCTERAAGGVVRLLRDRELLLIIDNCEHVIEKATELVEAILMAAPGMRILTTSREALRTNGELVRVLPPLPSPPPAPGLTALAALSYSAVQLFVERALAAQSGFSFTDRQAPMVAEICRRLDGVPLAIELAAAQAGLFGLAWLVSHLDNRLRLPNYGRRTAIARHQTLTAMLDWSYELLSERERVMLHYLADSASEFTLAEAIAMAQGTRMGATEVIASVGGLVAKSMLTSNCNGSMPRFRVPETTRLYAAAKQTSVMMEAA
jgi:predicted ATPase/DNA-binding winged helix-turn-helix (wHTH) protein